MKTILLGRAASGKSTLAKLMSDIGLKRAVTSTTRPPRDGEVDGQDYHFVDAKPEDSNVIAPTTHNGNDYWLDKNAMDDADFIILDADGLYELCQKMPQETISVLYMFCDPETLVERGVARGDDPDVLAERLEAENTMFAKFEHDLTNSALPKNILFVRTIKNDGSEDLASIAMITKNTIRLTRRIIGLVELAIKHDLIETKDGLPVVTTLDDTTHPATHAIPVERYAQLLLSDNNDLSEFMLRVLAIPDPISIA